MVKKEDDQCNSVLSLFFSFDSLLLSYSYSYGQIWGGDEIALRANWGRKIQKFPFTWFPPKYINFRIAWGFGVVLSGHPRVLAGRHAKPPSYSRTTHGVNPFYYLKFTLGEEIEWERNNMTI